MKRLTILLTVLSVLFTAPTFAQQSGKGASTASKTASDGNFAWGIGLGALAVLGVVVGVTVASATDTPSTFSH